MDFLDTQATFLLVGILLLTTVLAGSVSSRFGLPALIGFLGLGMLAGIDGPGGIDFENFALAQAIGMASLVFILFSGGLTHPMFILLAWILIYQTGEERRARRLRDD